MPVSIDAVESRAPGATTARRALLGNEAKQEKSSLSKPYLTAVILLTVVLPALSAIAEYLSRGATGGFVFVVGKWFIFWAVGVRLLLAGIRQMVNPAFTARAIFDIDHEPSLAIVRELGFANLCGGLVGVISLFVPSWRVVSAFASGLYYGIAGINHCVKKAATANELVAMISDLFIFAVLAAYVAMALLK